MDASSNAALLYQNPSGHSVANTSLTTVTGWTTSFDVTSNCKASTGTFTAPSTGCYVFNAQLVWGAMSGAGASGQLISTVFVNGSATTLQGKAPPSNTTRTTNVMQVSEIVSATAGQTILLDAFENTGSSVAHQSR